jgi:glycosyltransferase involved in cell wall biosynthesis/peptidoglycan/xylan/chitin deacetylase (PgdA/CDA1 family)
MIELSIIIPTYNRAERLRACLQALTLQTRPSTDFEVIVVVDGSSDGTRAMLASLSVPFPLTVLWQANQGQNVARNRGVDVARGRYLLFLDDDIVAEPALVAEHVRVQRSGERVVGIGQIAITLPRKADWFTRRFAEGWREHYEELNRNEKLPTWFDCYGGNMSVARSTFLEVNGFAEDVRRSHDIELGYRLMEGGASFVYVPGAVGRQDERKGIRELAKDFRSAGAAYVQLVQRHPAMLPGLLGGLADTSLREQLLRRALYLLHLPPPLLGWMGAFLRDSGRRWKWFRFVQNYFYWSGVRQAIRDRETWHRLMLGTPILMYHAFGGDEERGSRFIIPVRQFAQQMKWLQRLGYRVIGLEEFLRCRREHRLPPPRSVVITIDDAYADTLSHAYPVLHRHGYPATVFAVSDRVGAANAWSNGTGLKGRRLLSWGEIAEMARAGIEFGAHTATHPKLPELPEEQVRQEVIGSKTELENRLHVPIRSFAFPFGERDVASERVVKEAGFWGACGVDSGLNTPGTPIYALRRIEVQGTLSLFRFLLALWIGNTHLRLR